jgi:hypothetical protein
MVVRLFLCFFLRCINYSICLEYQENLTSLLWFRDISLTWKLYNSYSLKVSRYFVSSGAVMYMKHTTVNTWPGRMYWSSTGPAPIQANRITVFTISLKIKWDTDNKAISLASKMKWRHKQGQGKVISPRIQEVLLRERDRESWGGSERHYSREGGRKQ